MSEIEPTTDAEATRLVQAALGGRVAHSDFLDPAESASVLVRLRDEGVPAEAWGGFAGARRRVVTARPTHLPEAGTPLVGVYLESLNDVRGTREALLAAGVPGRALGDIVEHREGVSVVTFDPPPRALLDLRAVAGRTVEPQVVPLDRVAGGGLRRITAVVPSLRVDVLGAKGFRVSRSYFAKGVAGGKVSVNGRAAGKASSAGAGDEIWAEGLGRLRVLSVDGETRRGNLKVSLEVEQGQ